MAEPITARALREAAARARRQAEQDSETEDMAPGGAEAGTASDDSARSRSALGRSVADGKTRAQKAIDALGRALRAAQALWATYGRPILGFLEPPARWLARLYGRLFRRVAYTLGPDGTRDQVAPVRAGAMVIGTVVVVVYAASHWFFVPWALGAAWRVTSDTALYWTADEMRIYLHSPERIGDGLYEVSGCLSYPCDDQNTMYMIVQDNVWKDLEYVFSRGYPHSAEYTAGRLTGEANLCTAQKSGNETRWFQRTANLRTVILDLDCTPISVDRGPRAPSGAVLPAAPGGG